MASQESLEKCLQIYDECLNDEFMLLEKLVQTLCEKDGFWSIFCKEVVKQYGRKTREDIKTQILSFLCSLAQMALYNCRKGKDWLHEVHVSIQECTDFSLLFCGPVCRGGSARLLSFSQAEVKLARDCAYKILGVNPDEYNGLILRYAQIYILECRQGDFRHMELLTSLGAENGLDIESAGATYAEAQEWLYRSDLAQAQKAITELFGKPLYILLERPKAMAKNLAIVNQYLDPDPALTVARSGQPWFLRTKLVSLKDLQIPQADLPIYKQHLQNLEIQLRP